ncbi:DUF6766 family protein [Streptomyces sp. NPDC046805]|uniref:DUF6766 family protein n=1 Tax=Streptomyces sp. NPDC046805 TaxID=3155134 RepID=UPI0033C927D0
MPAGLPEASVKPAIFLWSWLAQSLTDAAAYNVQHLRQLQAPVSWQQYRGSADFWNRTLRNWQSEASGVVEAGSYAPCATNTWAPCHSYLTTADGPRRECPDWAE